MALFWHWLGGGPHRTTYSIRAKAGAYFMMIQTTNSDRPLRVVVNGEEVAVLAEDAAEWVEGDHDSAGDWYAYTDRTFELVEGENMLSLVVGEKECPPAWLGFLLRPVVAV